MSFVLLAVSTDGCKCVRDSGQQSVKSVALGVGGGVVQRDRMRKRSKRPSINTQEFANMIPAPKKVIMQSSHLPHFVEIAFIQATDGFQWSTGKGTFQPPPRLTCRIRTVGCHLSHSSLTSRSFPALLYLSRSIRGPQTSILKLLFSLSVLFQGDFP